MVFADVDEGASRIPEDQDLLVEMDVDAGRLNAIFAQWVDYDAPPGQLFLDCVVAENHKCPYLSSLAKL